MTSVRRRHIALIVYRALTDLAGKGAFFVVTVVAARRLSQESFGVFSLGTTVGWMTAVAADFGIQLHLARVVAQRPGDALPLLRGWLQVRLWTAALGLMAVALGAMLWSPPTVSRSVLVLLTAVYAVNGLVEFLHYFYRGLGRSDVESTLVLGQRAVMLVLATAALLWRGDVVLLAWAMLIPAIGGLLVSLRLAVRLGQQQSPSPAPSARRARTDDGLRDVWPVGVGIILSALYFRIDLFLVNAWVGMNGVALYSAVFRLVEALRLFPAAVLAVALPTLFRASSGQALRRLSIGLTAGGIAIAAVLWVVAGWLVPLFYGDHYTPAIEPFRVLLLSFPLMSLNYALTHQLVGWHGHRAYALLCAGALGVNVALNSVFIPSLGIVGASWATLWTEAVMTAGCLIALARTAVYPGFGAPGTGSVAG